MTLCLELKNILVAVEIRNLIHTKDHLIFVKRGQILRVRFIIRSHFKTVVENYSMDTGIYLRIDLAMCFACSLLDGAMFHP